ncbi:LuxR C-terminal-related transcriptional regulator [Streptomyces triculaminicus]|uniref:LuxR C-terminal-related transcriptional regulator n=1 Tax=Streptomyces triculaminicus TaxID=2816232 RepID=UPI0033EB133F
MLPTEFPDSRDERGEPLPAARFSAPALPRAHVRRQRLLDRLTDGANGPLTLVTGPAGSGKTTLVAAWARSETCRRPGPVAWLTLDTHDNAPGVFWSGVAEALRRALPALPLDPVAATRLRSAGRSLPDALAEAVERLPEPVVLVLDGFEKLPGRDVPAGLEFLLAHAGPRLRLVLTGRSDPPLPLHRYRAEDRLSEIRGADLVFTPREAAELLRRHGLTPGEDAVRTLTGRTEGWAAGLRLCALAMRRSDDPDGFARSPAAPEHAVTGYLLAEALGPRHPDARELLIRASILDPVTPGLANALTGRRDAERILSGLARVNAFVEAGPSPGPDTGASWYRLHPLYAAVLRTHLETERPGLAPRLHARAARRLAGSGQVAEALEHAAAAGDWRFCAREAVRHSPVTALLAGPEAERLDDVLRHLPADLPGAEAALLAAGRRLARHDVAACRRWLAEAERHLRDGRGHPAVEVRLSHALLRLLSGPDEACADALEASRTVQELAGQAHPALIEAHPELEALRCLGLARALLCAGRVDEARRHFSAAVEACSAETTALIRHEALGMLALTESAEGALGAAHDHASRSLELGDRHGVPPGRRRAAGHLALAMVAWERDDHGTARRHLEEAETCPGGGDDPVTAAWSAVLRCRAEAARGRAEAALAALDAYGPPRGAWAAERLALERSAVLLAHGDAEGAADALHEAGTDGPALVVALASAHLAAGRTGRALRLAGHADRSYRLDLPDRVRVALLRAHAAALEGDPADARRLLGRALEDARPEGLRRPFAEAGAWLPPLLDGTAGHDGASAAPWPPPRADGHEVRAPAPVPALVEPLSGREREVLACVARMLSTDEIAAELHLSANTVKTHLRSIYHKLCVSRRRAAVERGKELHIL